MLDAMEVMRDEGAFVADPYEIPNQAELNNFGICTTTKDPVPPAVPCSIVLAYGQKAHLNAYMEDRPNAPVHTLAEIIAFNSAHPDPAIALKYGQAIFRVRQSLDTSPGSADTLRYMQDRQKDLELTGRALTPSSTGRTGKRARETISTRSLPSELRRRRTGQGRLPEHRRSRRLRAGRAEPAAAGRVRPEPVPFGVTFSGPRVQRTEAHRSGLRVRAGDEAPRAA